MVQDRRKPPPLESWGDLPPLNPYPEFEDEVYQEFWESGLTPEKLVEPDRAAYRNWLKMKGYDKAPG